MNFRGENMKNSVLKRILAVMLVVFVLSTVLISAKAKKTSEVQILFTHDLHSRIEAETVSGKSTGGFAKIKTLIDEKKKENEATFVVDGGDFSMGTLYQVLYETHAPELTLMGYMGYDATTLGNHEFDYRSEGIANMLNSAKQNEKNDTSLTLPKLLVSNIDWQKNTSKDNKTVKMAFENYGVQEYTIIERGGVKVGIFGLMGQDAAECAPESKIVFEDIVKAAEKTVAKLKKEKVDVIICLSHSGTNTNEDESEDATLAKRVPEIDVIISGHTHTKLKTASIYGETYVVSARDYGGFLGEVDLVKKSNGRWELKNYCLNATSNKVKQDKTLLSKINDYRSLINQEYLSKFGYSLDDVLAANNYDFTPIDDLGKELREDTLGSLIADSYRYAVRQAEGEDYEEITLAIAPNGTIRDTIKKGKLTVWDAFNINSLGIGADRVVGYPLVEVYLTGAELKTVAEIDVSVSTLMSAAQIYPSGMKWTYNNNRLILNRVTDVKIVNEKGKEVEIEDKKLYRVVGGLYAAQMLSAVEDTSYGILSLTPKDKNGNPITDFEKHIIHDKNGNEVKEWYALASYLQSFPKNEQGVSVVPEKYAKPEGRKVANNSKNIVDILKNPNKIAVIVYLVIFVLILGLALVSFLVVRKIKRKKKIA